MWILDTAKNFWPGTKFVGIDIQKLDDPEMIAYKYPDVDLNNIRFTYFDFLKDKLPFKDQSFDMVRLAHLKWAVPVHKVSISVIFDCDLINVVQWSNLLQDVSRVLKRGGWVEIIDEDFVLNTSPAAKISPEISETYEKFLSDLLVILESRSLSLSPDPERLYEVLRNTAYFRHCSDTCFEVAFANTPPSFERSDSKARKVMGIKPTRERSDSRMSSVLVKKRSASFLQTLKARTSSMTLRAGRPRASSTASEASSTGTQTEVPSPENRGADCDFKDDMPVSYPIFLRKICSNNCILSKPFYPPGLQLPDRFLPLPPAELILHATHNMRNLISCKEVIKAKSLKRCEELIALEKKIKESPCRMIADLIVKRDELSAKLNKDLTEEFWQIEMYVTFILSLPSCSVLSCLC